MTVIELAKMIQTMRTAQRHYFKTRTSETLLQATRLEKEIDRAVESLLDSRPLLPIDRSED